MAERNSGGTRNPDPATVTKMLIRKIHWNETKFATLLFNPHYPAGPGALQEADDRRGPDPAKARSVQRRVLCQSPGLQKDRPSTLLWLVLGIFPELLLWPAFHGRPRQHRHHQPL